MNAAMWACDTGSSAPWPPRMPMRRIRPPCCARAASGHAAAAPPRSVMNSRRFIRSPHRPLVARMSAAICGKVVPGFRFAHPGYRVCSFNHLIDAAEQRERHGEAEGLGGFEVDDQLDLRGLLHRQISRLL